MACALGSNTALNTRKMNEGGPIFASPTMPRLSAGGNSSEVAYLLVSLQSPASQHSDNESGLSQPATVATPPDRFSQHRWWDLGQGWKNILNNLRLILQPYVSYYLLLPWLLHFDIPGFRTGFLQLIGIMNSLHAALPT